MKIITTKNYFHKTLIFYINKFDTVNWIIMIYACANCTIWLVDCEFHGNMSPWKLSYVTIKCKTCNYGKKTCNHYKLKLCLCDFKSPYYENCNHENLKFYINKLNTIFKEPWLCLCKFYYTLLSLMSCKFCHIMSLWKMTPLSIKNGICKLKSSTCDLKITYHENLKFYITEFYIMKWAPWNYTCANGVIPPFDLQFCDNMSPWNNTLVIVKNDTCDLKKWYL